MKFCMRIGVLAFVICTTVVGSLAKGPFGVHPVAGFVPDNSTAIRIAEAVLIPIYGQQKVESERPFTAKLSGNVWYVEGYLPPEMIGGVAEVWINKADGRILRVTHGK